MYIVSTPKLFRKFYPTLIWQIDTDEKCLYLTFDDGPHETATPFVLDTLKQFDAKATFFCIGKNVYQNRAVFERILAEGHAVGNHTQNHANGWDTNNYYYIKDVQIAGELIQSNLFRPPYGRIKRSQIKLLQEVDQDLTSNSDYDEKEEGFTENKESKSAFNIIMWSVLSGDFDKNISKEKCLKNVLRNTKKGSIIVFHDSAKAFDRLEYALPKTLEHFSKQGYQFKSIEMK